MMQTGRSRALRAALISSVLIVGASAISQAAPITYQVNRTIEKGSVKGFIETDGATGILGASDFVDWNLILSDGKNTYQLTRNNSTVFVSGMDVGAFNNPTGNQHLLLFNFSGVDFGTLLFSQGTKFAGVHYYCDSSQPYFCIPGETVVPLSSAAGYQTQRLLGVVTIGVADATPEPGTLSLLLVAGSWLGWRVRGRVTR